MSRGARGPKKKPPHLKVVEGNPGKRPIEEGVKAPPEAPDEPDWRAIFPGNAKGIGEVRKDAAREWAAVVPVLDKIGILSTVDRALLIDYCVCWARLLECERKISTMGLAVEGERGWMKNPHITAAGQYRTQLKSYIGELGLGPSSRGTMKPPEGRSGDEDGILDP